MQPYWSRSRRRKWGLRRRCWCCLRHCCHRYLPRNHSRSPVSVVREAAVNVMYDVQTLHLTYSGKGVVGDGEGRKAEEGKRQSREHGVVRLEKAERNSQTGSLSQGVYIPGAA